LGHNRGNTRPGRKEQAGADSTQNAEHTIRGQRHGRVDLPQNIEEWCREEPHPRPGDHREDEELLLVRRHQLVHAGQDHRLGTGDSRLGNGGYDHPQTDFQISIHWGKKFMINITYNNKYRSTYSSQHW